MTKIPCHRAVSCRPLCVTGTRAMIRRPPSEFEECHAGSKLIDDPSGEVRAREPIETAPLVTRVPTDRSGTAGGNLQNHCGCLRQGADQVVGSLTRQLLPPLNSHGRFCEVALDCPQLVAGDGCSTSSEPLRRLTQQFGRASASRSRTAGRWPR
jgi:hypothetical protein